MNKRIRFLVLDSKNIAQRPSDHGIFLPGVQSDKSPSFTDEASAQSFATILASRNKGQNYYLAMVKAAVVSYTAALGGEKLEAANVAWTTTTPDGATGE